MWTARTSLPKYFYPRPPRGGRRTCLYEAGRDEDISIHALREEGDAAVVLEDYEETKFLSTPSARRATVVPCCLRTLLPNFYPRPPRGGRPAQLARASAAEAISIHALREEGDRTDTYFAGMPRISIHALREEGDAGTTISAAKGTYFYPRPPRGGRPGAATPSRTPCSISIHALREEGDLGRTAFCMELDEFLSTPSARRATFVVDDGHLEALISIHALREEGDGILRDDPAGASQFLSTPSARRATR